MCTYYSAKIGTRYRGEDGDYKNHLAAGGCDDRELDFDFEGNFPSGQEFAVAIKAGMGLAGEDAEKLDHAVRNCFQAASKAETKGSLTMTRRAFITCGVEDHLHRGMGKGDLSISPNGNP
jgi:hypothetical protein